VSKANPSIWDRHDNNEAKIPRYCPHCGEQLAHPDDMKDNDDLDGNPGRTQAYRLHRQAHYGWGVDPAEVYYGGDPYLADYYGDSTSTGPTMDQDEVVAHAYEVTIHYEATLRTKVVAADEGHAKEKAQILRDSDTDLWGNVPTPEITHKIHDEVRESYELTRAEVEESADVDEDEDDGVNYAERLPGWPW
jgi:hypothetical protein